MCLVIIFMIIIIIIYPQEMTFTSIIEFLEKDPKRLHGAQCADLRSVCTRLSYPFSLAPPPIEPGYEASSNLACLIVTGNIILV